MRNQDPKQRTRSSALDVINLVENPPRDMVSQVLGKQLLGSGTSVAAKYRSATRAKSTADFVVRRGIVEEEADESVLWADLLEASNRISGAAAEPAKKEAGELTAIAVASIGTARQTASESKTCAQTAFVPRSPLPVPRSK